MRVLRRFVGLVGRVLDRVGRALVSWAGGSTRATEPADRAEEADHGPPDHWLRYIRQRAPWLLAGNRLRARPRGRPPPSRPEARGETAVGPETAARSETAAGPEIVGGPEAATTRPSRTPAAQRPEREGSPSNERRGGPRRDAPRVVFPLPPRLLPSEIGLAEPIVLSPTRAASTRGEPTAAVVAPQSRADSSGGRHALRSQPPDHDRFAGEAKTVVEPGGSSGGGADGSHQRLASARSDASQVRVEPDEVARPSSGSIPAPPPAWWPGIPPLRVDGNEPQPVQQVAGDEGSVESGIRFRPKGEHATGEMSRQQSARWAGRPQLEPEERAVWPDLPESGTEEAAWQARSNRALLREQRRLARLRAEQAGSSWSGPRS